jgi:8-oxo-dGTP pyrophosphatase MutT (NUDIX family)
MKPTNIRVIAICLFAHNDRILVLQAFDTVKGTPYYRPLGGEVDPGETTLEALRREIHEELTQEITDARLLGVLENLFEWEGKPEHEIVFVYDARFVDNKVYSKKELVVQEQNEISKASWRSIDFFNDYHRLVPEKLTPLVKSHLRAL